VGTVTANTTVTLTGSIARIKDPVALEQRAVGGVWEPGAAVTPAADATFSVKVTPTVTTQYRLVVGKVRTKALRVTVAS